MSVNLGAGGRAVNPNNGVSGFSLHTFFSFGVPGHLGMPSGSRGGLEDPEVSPGGILVLEHRRRGCGAHILPGTALASL